jgi:hypothetical protein
VLLRTKLLTCAQAAGSKEERSQDIIRGIHGRLKILSACHCRELHAELFNDVRACSRITKKWHNARELRDIHTRNNGVRQKRGVQQKRPFNRDTHPAASYRWERGGLRLVNTTHRGRVDTQGTLVAFYGPASIACTLRIPRAQHGKGSHTITLAICVCVCVCVCGNVYVCCVHVCEPACALVHTDVYRDIKCNVTL